jgi:uncharacterized OsmC-like protein
MSERRDAETRDVGSTASMTFAVRILFSIVVIALFTRAGVSPATAGAAPCAPRPADLLKMADAGAYYADRGACAQKARSDVEAWRVKLDMDMQKRATDDLNKAWTKASDAAAKLETTSAADWESAKASFNKASDEFAATWTKVRAEVK